MKYQSCFESGACWIIVSTNQVPEGKAATVPPLMAWYQGWVQSSICTLTCESRIRFASARVFSHGVDCGSILTFMSSPINWARHCCWMVGKTVALIPTAGPLRMLTLPPLALVNCLPRLIRSSHVCTLDGSSP